MKWLFRMHEQRERRSAHRTPVNLPVVVRQDHNIIRGVMVNISRSGAAVELISVEPLAGQIEIEVPIGVEGVHFQGRIIYANDTGMENCRRYGIAFSGSRAENLDKAMEVIDAYYEMQKQRKPPEK